MNVFKCLIGRRHTGAQGVRGVEGGVPCESRMDAELEMLDEMALDFAARELTDGREECDHYPFGPFFDGRAPEGRARGLLLRDGARGARGGAGKGVAALRCCWTTYAAPTRASGG